MNPKIPNVIRPTLQTYISVVNEQLPCLINAFYLEGSIALGGFSPRFSDVDFVAILGRQPAPTEIDRLRNVHKVIEERQSQWKMSGSYIQLDDLSRCDDKSEPNLYYHDGILRGDGYFELQSVEGWILKRHGIAVIGPEPRNLPYAVDWAVLITKMKENLNSYWVSWTRRPDRLIMMHSDWGIQWTVLGVLRQFYSFQENSITTKTGAGQYALICVPPHWHRLIQEALSIREGKTTAAFRFRLARAIETVAFLKFIIHTCNAMHG